MFVFNLNKLFLNFKKKPRNNKRKIYFRILEMLCNVRSGLLSLLTAKIYAGLESDLSHTEKIIYSIALQTIFHEYSKKNRKINIS